MKTIKKVSIGVLSLCILACGGAALSVNSASANTAPEMSFEAGASVRVTTADYGIRFHAYYDETAYGYATDDSTATEAGMIIVPAQALENASEDIFGYLKATYNKDKETVSTAFAASQFTEETDGTYSAYGSIIGILDANLTLEYQAVAYATADGVNYTYSEASDVRTIAQVLSGALNSSTVSDTMRSKVIDTAVAVQTAAPSVSYTLDIDVKDGVPFALTGDYALTAATFGETALTVESGKITSLTKTDAYLGDKTVIVDGEETTVFDPTQKVEAMALTFGAKGTLNVNATVWSLIINTAEELTQMQTYTYMDSDYYTHGYIKLGNDIDMANTAWTADYTVGRSTYANANGAANGNYWKKGFVGVFDGCGYDIQNFNITAAHTALFYRLAYASETYYGIVKNVDFTNAVHNVKFGAALVSDYVSGGLVENVSIDINYKVATSGTYGAYGGALFSLFNSYKNFGVLTVRNVSITNTTAQNNWNTMMTRAASHAKGPKQYGFCALGYLDNSGGDYTEKISFENFTPTNFSTHMLFVNVNGTPTPVASVDGYVTVVTAE